MLGKYRFSHHARREMERRNIPLALVEEVLDRPEQVVPERAGRKAYADYGHLIIIIYHHDSS
jgi:hypothetical protein